MAGDWTQGSVKRSCGDVYYEVHGPDDAPALVMVRGLGRCIRHWLGFERRFAQTHRVITVELRGVGKCTSRMSPFDTLEDLADDIIAVLDALHIDSAHILGISLGGMVTLACGLRHPLRCRSLIVINTSIAGLRLQRITPTALAAIAMAAVRQPAAMHRGLVDVLVGPDFPDERKALITEEYVKIAADDGLFGTTVIKQLIAAARFLVARKLSTLQMPALVVYGTADRFVPPANSINIGKLLPNATMLPIANGGHELPLDKPEELHQGVTRWLQQRT